MFSCCCWRHVIILTWPLFLLFGTSRFLVVTHFLCDQRRLLSNGEKGTTVCFSVIAIVPIYPDPSAFQLTVSRWERASCIFSLVRAVYDLTSVDPAADQQMSPHDFKSHQLWTVLILVCLSQGLMCAFYGLFWLQGAFLDTLCYRSYTVNED